MPKKGGQALKHAIHVARARAGVTSDMQLALRAHVSYDTLMNWFSSRTVPRPHELKKVADSIGTSYGDLMAAYEGRDPEPQPLQDAVSDLTAAVRALIVEIREERDRGQDAAAAIVRAVGSLPTPGGSPASNGPPAPRETTGSK
jgi:transcriptional regulator with XRE-family HTH domain